MNKQFVSPTLSVSLRSFAAAIVCLCLVDIASVQAAQLYRYKDESGKTVLNSTIPPQYVGKGYDILNERGRLLQRVPPALTPEEIAARDAEKARQAALAAQRAEQERIDGELKQLYSHPDDAVRVLKRRVQDINGVIQLKKRQIETAEQEILDQESRAANIQRNGRAIPESLLATIKNLKSDIKNADADILELLGERGKVIGEFNTKIRRLEIITEKSATDYDAWLKTQYEMSADDNQNKQNSDAQSDDSAGDSERSDAQNANS